MKRKELEVDIAKFLKKAGNDIDELNSILEVVSDVWNYFPHKWLDGLLLAEMLMKARN